MPITALGKKIYCLRHFGIFSYASVSKEYVHLLQNYIIPCVSTNLKWHGIYTTAVKSCTAIRNKNTWKPVFGIYFKLDTHSPPSRKLQTFSSRFDTKWNVSLIICCCVSSLCERKHTLLGKQDWQCTAHETVKHKVLSNHLLLKP